MSDNSKNGDEEAKSQLECSLKVSGMETPIPLDNLFEGSLKYEECVKILVKCMRNLEKEVKEIHSLACSTNDNHIKDKKQVTDLSKALKFVFESFDELKKKKKEKLINDLKNEVSSLSIKF